MTGCLHIRFHRRNFRADDEPVLRYVPYFGDDDTTGLSAQCFCSTGSENCLSPAGVDVSAYDLVPGEMEEEIKSEVRLPRYQ
jgi:hypothetical protein